MTNDTKRRTKQAPFYYESPLLVADWLAMNERDDDTAVPSLEAFDLVEEVSRNTPLTKEINKQRSSGQPMKQGGSVICDENDPQVFAPWPKLRPHTMYMTDFERFDANLWPSFTVPRPQTPLDKLNDNFWIEPKHPEGYNVTDFFLRKHLDDPGWVDGSQSFGMSSLDILYRTDPNLPSISLWFDAQDYLSDSKSDAPYIIAPDCWGMKERLEAGCNPPPNACFSTIDELDKCIEVLTPLRTNRQYYRDLCEYKLGTRLSAYDCIHKYTFNLPKDCNMLCLNMNFKPVSCARLGYHPKNPSMVRPLNAAVELKNDEKCTNFNTYWWHLYEWESDDVEMDCERAFDACRRGSCFSTREHCYKALSACGARNLSCIFRTLNVKSKQLCIFPCKSVSTGEIKQCFKPLSHLPFDDIWKGRQHLVLSELREPAGARSVDDVEESILSGETVRSGATGLESGMVVSFFIAWIFSKLLF